MLLIVANLVILAHVQHQGGGEAGLDDQEGLGFRSLVTYFVRV